jgi:DNA-binding transcriptional regulator YdaS (Cro superfamily)
MEKAEAIRLLGGTQASVAKAIGITSSAVSQWPDVLPRVVVDRVQAALWRKHVGANTEGQRVAEKVEA